MVIGTTASANGMADPDWATAADTFAIIVDNSDGKLKFLRVVTGAGDGGPIYVVLEAWLSHGR